MEDKVRFSVIVPVYNRIDEVRDLLDKPRTADIEKFRGRDSRRWIYHAMRGGRQGSFRGYDKVFL